METRDNLNQGEAGPIIGQLGERIKELRIGRGWSLRQLARQSGISHTHVAQIERGEVKEPSVLKVVAIATTFGVSVESLIVGPTEAERPPVQPEIAIDRVRADLLALAALDAESLEVAATIIALLRKRAEKHDRQMH
jgi:transcriptional regulator with XRE-family HTH domain